MAKTQRMQAIYFSTSNAKPHYSDIGDGSRRRYKPDVEPKYHYDIFCDHAIVE